MKVRVSMTIGIGIIQAGLRITLLVVLACLCPVTGTFAQDRQRSSYLLAGARRMHGRNVVRLQKALIFHGYGPGSHGVDGRIEIEEIPSVNIDDSSLITSWVGDLGIEIFGEGPTGYLASYTFPAVDRVEARSMTDTRRTEGKVITFISVR